MVVVAVVLLVVLRAAAATTRAATTDAGKVPTIVVDKDGKPGRRHRRARPTTRATRSASRSKSAVTDEVHVHGYDIMKDVKAGGTVTFDFPADDRRRLRGRAGGPQGTDHRTDGQPVSLTSPCRSRHALVARQDLPIPAWLFAWGASIVLIVSFFALSAAWRKPRFEEEHWRPLGARALARPARAARRRSSAGRSASSCSASRSTPGLHGTEAPDRNFALTFLFVTAWLGFPFVSACLRRRLPALQPLAGDRPGASAAAFARDRRAAAAPTSPTRERLGRWPAAIGLLAFVWLEVVYGGERRRRGRASTRTPPPSPPSSTASTRWR